MAELNKTSWEITARRHVGFIDIMGFKDMVSRQSHTDIYSMMESIHALNQDAIEFNNLLWDEDILRITTYSDSIIVYSKDESKLATECFLFTMAGISDTLFAASVPHKGAVAFGLMTFDEGKSIFFGQPLIDSYLLQEEILFYGILVHGSSEKEIVNIDSKIIELHNYKCPLKLGISNHLTIAPWHSKTEEHKLKIFGMLQQMRFNTSGHLRKYIDNTENYFTEIFKGVE